jgi:hypothetical protein
MHDRAGSRLPASPPSGAMQASRTGTRRVKRGGSTTPRAVSQNFRDQGGLACGRRPHDHRRADDRRIRPNPWSRAGQACSGGSAGLAPPDPPAAGAGAILFSQQIGHSRSGRPCRPCSCSHATCATPATSTTSRPAPKGNPGTLGIRRSIAAHLPSTRRCDQAWQPPHSSVTPHAEARSESRYALF